MIKQFAAYLTNTDTSDEYMIAANTAEEAEALGTMKVKTEAEEGVTLEMILGPLVGPSLYPTGQFMRVDRL
jgi:hypothetical protein